MKINLTDLEVVRASALDVAADAIVNAASTAMRGGGGIDGAIHAGAGRALMEELREVAPDGAATSEVVVTSGHNLPHTWILHVAGPIWNPGRADECDELLGACYGNTLEESDSRGLESVVMPSISTGIYGFPIVRAAPIALETAIEFLQSHPTTTLRRVTFALRGEDEHAVFRRALQTLADETYA